MFIEAKKLRDIIKLAIPDDGIVPEHTDNSHHYRINIFSDKPLYDSVTTKTSILDKGYLKRWGISLAMNYIRDHASEVANETTRETVLYDASQQAELSLEDAGGVGTRAHAIIEEYINQWIDFGIRPGSILALIPASESDSRVVSAVLACEKFCQEHYIIPIHSELLVASKKLKTAGTMDFLCFIGTVQKQGTIAGCIHDFWQRGGTPYKQECIICGEKVEYELAIVDWKTSNSIKGKTEYALQTAAYKGCLKELTGLNPKKLWVIRLDKNNKSYEKGIVVDPQGAYKAYTSVAELYDYIHQDVEHLQVVTKERKVLNIDI